MPRPPRIEYADAIYHVTTRGIEGRTIAMDNRDRARWMEQLERVVARCEWRLFAFALMGNHFHLFVQTPQPNLSKGMHDLNGGYVSFFNVRHQRKGHLFQSRYKAYVVEDEGYWLEISRYVHLNPVRAGLVAKPEDWPWSSYIGYHRPRLRLSWVDYTRVLDDFDGDTKQGRRQYREFMEDGLDRELDSPFDRAVQGIVLGSDRFFERIQGLLASPTGEYEPFSPGGGPDLQTIVDAVARHYDVNPAGWVPGRRSNHPARRVAVYLARELTSLPLLEISAALGYANPDSAGVLHRRVAHASRRSDLVRDIRVIRAKLQGTGSRP